MQRLYADWKAILRYGLVLSLIVTVALLIAFSIEPLAFVTDLPLEVQEKIGEIPKRAIPVGWSVFLTVIFSCIGLSILMNRAIFKDKSGKATFINLLLNTFLLLNFFNLWDVVVIDIIIFDTIKPDFMKIPGAEEYVAEYVNAKFHIIGFFKGQPYMLFFALLSVGIYKLIFRGKDTKNPKGEQPAVP